MQRCSARHPEGSDASVSRSGFGSHFIPFGGLLRDKTRFVPRRA
ncbi:MAG: hypothetical protein AAF721_22675 [Myxococcota bacterium]